MFLETLVTTFPVFAQLQPGYEVSPSLFYLGNRGPGYSILAARKMLDPDIALAGYVRSNRYPNLVAIYRVSGSRSRVVEAEESVRVGWVQ